MTTPDRPSALARLVPALIALRGSKKTFASADRTMEHARSHVLRPESFSPPIITP